MRTKGIMVCCTAVAIMVTQGCGGDGASAVMSKAEAPAKVETKPVGEAALTRITLTPEAEQRLGIVTVETANKAARRFYTVAGEVALPPGQALVVSSPVSGSVTMADGGLPAAGSRVSEGQILFRITPLLPIQRDLRVNADTEVAAALTRLEAAKARAGRAARLLQDRVGSVRAKEDADEAVLLAENDLAAARSRLKQIEDAPLEAEVAVTIKSPQAGVLRQVNVAGGQMVSAGAALCEVERLDPVWVRAPVYSGDTGTLVRNASARVRPINAGTASSGRAATPVEAPPTADPVAGTTDFYYQLGNDSLTLRPGERVSIAIPVEGEGECLQVPYAAILYDINGGTWVYENSEPHVFTRRRVAVESISGDAACLSEGPAPGTAVVTDGAAELFGTEFGAG